MRLLLTWCCTSLMTLLVMSCGGENSSAPSQPDQSGGVGNPSMLSLQVTPTQDRIPIGFEQQFTALATMSDGSVQDVTTDTRLNWTSSDSAIVAIDANGLAKGVALGTAIITAAGVAADGRTVSATAHLEVTDAHVTALQVTPATATVPVGLAQQFMAIAFLSDGSSMDVTDDAALSWTSSDPSIATISSASAGGNGLATGVATGTVTITASGSANGTPFSATAELTVTSAIVTALQVTPAAATVPVGLAQQFTAIAFLSDGSSMDVTDDAALSWTSSAPSIATISSVRITTHGDRSITFMSITK
jgi:uncharacterized protein YjdB